MIYSLHRTKTNNITEGSAAAAEPMDLRMLNGRHCDSTVNRGAKPQLIMSITHLQI